MKLEASAKKIQLHMCKTQNDWINKKLKVNNFATVISRDVPNSNISIHSANTKIQIFSVNKCE